MSVALFKLTDQIIGELLKAEYRRLHTWIDKLIQKNQEYYPQTYGFLFNGFRHKQSNVTGQLPRFPELHPDLWDEGYKFHKDHMTIKQETAFIRQGLVSILEDCKDNQDIRDALPDCIVEMIEPLRALPRTREEAFTIKDKPRQLKQWQKIRSNIDVYVSARLMF